MDFGKFYAFSLAPITVLNNTKYCVGTIFDAVDKKTGRIFSYDITSDVNAFLAAKRVSVKTIFDTKINEAVDNKRSEMK